MIKYLNFQLSVIIMTRMLFYKLFCTSEERKVDGWLLLLLAAPVWRPISAHHSKVCGL